MDKVVNVVPGFAKVSRRPIEMMIEEGFDVEELTGWGFDEGELQCFDIDIPDDNKDIDEDAMAETENECPKCGFKW